jgi:hypothetical protein
MGDKINFPVNKRSEGELLLRKFEEDIRIEQRDIKIKLFFVLSMGLFLASGSLFVLFNIIDIGVKSWFGIN